MTTMTNLLMGALLIGATLLEASPAHAHGVDYHGQRALRPSPQGISRERVESLRHEHMHRALQAERARLLSVMSRRDPRYRAWLARARREHAEWHAELEADRPPAARVFPPHHIDHVRRPSRPCHGLAH